LAPERERGPAIDAIDRELALYSERLAGKPQILVLTKKDALQDETVVEAARREAQARGRALHVVSAVTGEGLTGLLRAAADAVAGLDAA
jgi:GTP-binding protein